MTHWWCRTCRRSHGFYEGEDCCVPRATVLVSLADVDMPEGRDSGVQLGPFVNLYGCTVGSESRIGAYTEVQAGVVIGKRVKVGSHSFLCTGVTVEDCCFIGHGVMFCNDRHPRAVRPDGEVVGDGDWKLEPTIVRAGASIGSGAVILPGVTIGAGAVVGAGSVVAKDVGPGATVHGPRAAGGIGPAMTWPEVQEFVRRARGG